MKPSLMPSLSKGPKGLQGPQGRKSPRRRGEGLAVLEDLVVLGGYHASKTKRPGSSSPPGRSRGRTAVGDSGAQRCIVTVEVWRSMAGTVAGTLAVFGVLAGVRACFRTRKRTAGRKSDSGPFSMWFT